MNIYYYEYHITEKRLYKYMVNYIQTQNTSSQRYFSWTGIENMTSDFVVWVTTTLKHFALGYN